MSNPWAVSVCRKHQITRFALSESLRDSQSRMRQVRQVCSLTHTHTFTHTAWLQILKVACLQTFQLLLLIALLIFSLRFEGSSLKWKCRTRWDLLKILLISNSSHYGFIKIWVNNGCFLAISRMSDRRALGVQLCERSQKRTCAASKQEMKTYKGRSLFPCLSPWVWIRGGWKCIKPQSRKTKQTKQSKHTHTHTCMSQFFPFLLGEKLGCCCSTVESLFWHPIILPLYHFQNTYEGK